MEITFLFIRLPYKFGGLAAQSWSYLLSLDLWDSSARARSHTGDGDAAGVLLSVLKAWGNWDTRRAVCVSHARGSSLGWVSRWGKFPFPGGEQPRDRSLEMGKPHQ